MVTLPCLTGRLDFSFHFGGSQRWQVLRRQTLGGFKQLLNVPAADLLAQKVFKGRRREQAEILGLAGQWIRQCQSKFSCGHRRWLVVMWLLV